jgi:AcrR family transcriptional regulator
MTQHLNTVKSSPRTRASYHHGDLREALISAAEEILRERGATGFSLREAARRAGVSPGAPAHHFGDSRGLLTAVAARGFERLADELRAATAEAPRDGRLRALGAAYLRFAQENGPLFGIMWLRDLLNPTDANYLAAGRAAFNVLERVATGKEVPVATSPHIPDPAVVAVWATVHGLAKLTLDGALETLPADHQSKVLDLLPTLGHSSTADQC